MTTLDLWGQILLPQITLRVLLCPGRPSRGPTVLETKPPFPMTHLLPHTLTETVTEVFPRN